MELESVAPAAEACPAALGTVRGGNATPGPQEEPLLLLCPLGKAPVPVPARTRSWALRDGPQSRGRLIAHLPVLPTRLNSARFHGPRWRLALRTEPRNLPDPREGTLASLRFLTEPPPPRKPRTRPDPSGPRTGTALPQGRKERRRWLEHGLWFSPKIQGHRERPQAFISGPKQQPRGCPGAGGNPNSGEQGVEVGVGVRRGRGRITSIGGRPGAGSR